MARQGALSKQTMDWTIHVERMQISAVIGLMSTQFTILIEVICVALFVVTGCSDENNRVSTVTEQSMQQPDSRRNSTNQKAPILSSNQQSLYLPQISSNASKSVLCLDPVNGDDFGYKYMAQALIERSSDAQAALKKPVLTITDERISKEDLDWISSEAGKIDKFVLSEHAGTAVKYDRFVIAVVGGHIDERYFNLYFIRISGHGWIYLEKRERFPRQWVHISDRPL